MINFKHIISNKKLFQRSFTLSSRPANNNEVNAAHTGKKTPLAQNLCLQPLSPLAQNLCKHITV